VYMTLNVFIVFYVQMGWLPIVIYVSALAYEQGKDLSPRKI